MCTPIYNLYNKLNETCSPKYVEDQVYTHERVQSDVEKWRSLSVLFGDAEFWCRSAAISSGFPNDSETFASRKSWIDLCIILRHVCIMLTLLFSRL